MKKKLNIALFTLFILYAAMGSALDKNGNFESNSERDEYLMVALQKIAKQMNNQIPIMVDDETQLTSCLVAGKTINIFYKLINFKASEVNADEIQKHVWEQKNYNACKDKSTRQLIDMGVIYFFTYFDKDDRLITRVSLDKYKCK
jgi:hypothetical protein